MARQQFVSHMIHEPHDCLVQDFIPFSRYIEPVHLVINTGSGWIELCLDTF
jgi:hypothetical protein